MRGCVMQNKQVPVLKSEEQALSLREQQLISHLETVWKNSYKPSPEVFKRIIEFLLQLPEPYQRLGMTRIAENIASSMGLHFMDLMARFQSKAKLAGMEQEEIGETLTGAIAEFFPEMMGIGKQIQVKSLDDLVTLSNIIFSLYTLSQTDAVEDMQSWIYELPTLYQRQLSQERLMTNMQFQLTVTQTATIKNYSVFASWNSSLPNPVNPDRVSIPTTEQKGLTIA
jgi:hypothetical protein